MLSHQSATIMHRPAILKEPQIEYQRLSCFLSYSRAYKGAMARVKNLLEALDFAISVFDGPNPRPPAEVVNTEIAQADVVVVLLGPEQDGRNSATAAPAMWPVEEAVHAHGQGKPIALITHPNVAIPGMLQAYQTPPRFDFWSDESYADNVHHVIQHLLDTKRSVQIPPGDSPFYYERAAFRFRVDSADTLVYNVYHQLVARQRWSTVHHSVDTGLDHTASARLTIRDFDSVQIEATMGSVAHSLTIDWEGATQHEQGYVVTFTPPVPPGGRIGYRRRFELVNHLPLTTEELSNRSTQPGFPDVYRQGNVLYYGKSFEVHAEMDALTISFQFPATMEVRSCRALSMVMGAQQRNDKETERINAGDALHMVRSEETGDTHIELEVAHPLTSHSYILLYEPGRG